MKKIVHVVGTGTIGEPLLGLFTDFRDRMGIDEVTFHKRTPLASDRAKLNHLIQRGAKLAVDDDVRSEFEKLGHEVSFESLEALERATVVVDCTPAGNENKEKFYENLTGPKGFLAQGSEFGFGKPYARGINEEILVPGEDRFIQIVSCNTHNISTLIKTICDGGNNSLPAAPTACRGLPETSTAHANKACALLLRSSGRDADGSGPDPIIWSFGRTAASPFAMLAAAPPFRVAAREGVQLARHLDQGSRHRRVADVVFALVGVDVPVALAGEAGQGLVGVAIATLDRDIADVDLVAHRKPPRTAPVPSCPP